MVCSSSGPDEAEDEGLSVSTSSEMHCLDDGRCMADPQTLIMQFVMALHDPHRSQIAKRKKPCNILIPAKLQRSSGRFHSTSNVVDFVEPASHQPAH